MASLIGPLAVGFANCPSGSVLIRAKGTGVDSALVYTDADGTVSAGTTHTLDQYGAIVRYVKEQVDCTVRTAAGATHRAFTHVEDARIVALENSGWTGAYPGGVTAPGGLTTEDIAWGRMFTSLGAVDGKALVSGVATSIGPALSASTALYFNVKSATYGAVGNGTTDDTIAVTAAITAANTAGGGIVYFPPGNYRLGSITIPSSFPIQLLGAGPGVSTIRTKSGAAAAFGESSTGTVYSNLGFRAETSAISITSFWGTSITGCITRFENCLFGNATDNNVISAFALVTATGTKTYFSGCRFVYAGPAVSVTGATNRVFFDGCQFPAHPASGVAVNSASVAFVNCDLEIGTATTVGNAWIGSTGNVSWTGGRIVGNWGGSGTSNVSSSSLTITGAHVSTAAGSTLNLVSGSINLIDGGNFIDRTTGTTNLRADGSLATPAAGVSVSRGEATLAASVAGTTYTLDLADNRMIRVTHTSGASMQFVSPTSSTVMGPGDYTWILYKNSSGGALTPTFDAGFIVSPALTAVTNTRTSVYEVRNLGAGGTNALYVRELIGDSTAAL